MEVHIAGLRIDTFKSEFSLDREEDERLEDYLENEIDRRINYVHEHIRIATEEKPRDQPLFFTLPEFFWNVKWSVLRSEDELHRLTDYMLNALTNAHQRLIEPFPVEEVGQLIVIGGTAAVLIQLPSGIYESLNYCLIGNNYQALEQGGYHQSMWPKRATSHIDFGVKQQITEHGFRFRLSDSVTVEVLDHSDHAGEQNTQVGYSISIENEMLAACPFSINLCLDYAVLTADGRNDELQNSQSKIDFLISCGMSLDQDHAYPPSVVLTMVNDGMAGGTLAYARVSNGQLGEMLEHRDLVANLSLLGFDVG